MRLHLIAIGGAIMHNLALELAAQGHEVTGSDDEIYAPSYQRLEAAGLLPTEMGWDAGRIDTALDAVIVGMHARPDNPELHQATKLGLPVYSFPQFVARHARAKTRVVVAGSHGKTTTTAMIMHALRAHSIDFDYLVGAQLEGFERMVRLTDAPIMILEGDEYLSSPTDSRPKFWHYKPHLGVITGIAWDHINVFPTFKKYKKAFQSFAEYIEPGGKLFYYKNDEGLRKFYKHTPVEHTAYVAPPHYIEKGQTIVRSLSGEYPLQIFGRHNMENLQAARLVCRELGLSDAAFFEAMTTFKGAAKRMQLLWQDKARNVAIYRDFAHAPSKVRATVRALQQQFPARRLVAVVELHTYSSLHADFLPQYQKSLSAASEAVVLFSPHTLQMKKMPAISAAQVRQAFDDENLIVYTQKEALAAYLAQLPEHNCNVLLMSSGQLAGLDLTALRL